MRFVTEKNVKQFELFLYEQEKSDNTIEKYMRDIRFFCEWLGKNGVDKSTVLQYKKELCERYLPASVNSILSSLNALFMYMNWYDLKVKTLKIQRRIFADKEKELTKAEYDRLLTAAESKRNERLYYLMQTMGSTGLRVSELKYVTVDAVSTGQAIINCKGKIRQVLLPKQLCKMLKTYIKEQNIKNGSVFITRNGKPLDRSTVWKMLKSLCESANVARSKVFPHNFRHLFAKALNLKNIDLGASVETIRESAFEGCVLETLMMPASVTDIEVAAFVYSQIANVDYEGTEERRNFININNLYELNEPILNAAWSYGTVQPDAINLKMNAAGYYSVQTVGVEAGTQMLVSYYTADGEFVSLATQTYDGTDNLSFDIIEGADYAKVMMWKSIDSMMPVCSSKTAVFPTNSTN